MTVRALYAIADPTPFEYGEQATLIEPHLQGPLQIDFFWPVHPRLGGGQPNRRFGDWSQRRVRPNWWKAAKRLHAQLRSKEYDIIHTWDRHSSEILRMVWPFLGRAAQRTKWIAQATEVPRSPFVEFSRSIPKVRAPDWLIGDKRMIASSAEHPKSTSIAMAIPLPQTRNRDLHSYFGFPTEVKLIGAVCPLEARFGLKHLIWALDQIKCVRSDLRLLVWGTGSIAESLRRYARHVGVLDWIRWLVPSDDIREAFAGLDLYWHVPRRRSLPPELVAALVQELPAIATETMATKELAAIWPGRFKTVSWGARDEIARQTNQWLDRRDWPEPSSAAIQWMNSHSPATVARDYLQVYERVRDS